MKKRKIEIGITIGILGIALTVIGFFISKNINVTGGQNQIAGNKSTQFQSKENEITAATKKGNVSVDQSTYKDNLFMKDVDQVIFLNDKTDVGMIGNLMKERRTENERFPLSKTLEYSGWFKVGQQFVPIIEGFPLPVLELRDAKRVKNDSMMMSIEPFLDEVTIRDVEGIMIRRHETLLFSKTEWLTYEEKLRSDKPLVFRLDSARIVRITLLGTKNVPNENNLFERYSYGKGIVHLKFEVAGSEGF